MAHGDASNDTLFARGHRPTSGHFFGADCRLADHSLQVDASVDRPRRSANSGADMVTSFFKTTCDHFLCRVVDFTIDSLQRMENRLERIVSDVLHRFRMSRGSEKTTRFSDSLVLLWHDEYR